MILKTETISHFVWFVGFKGNARVIIPGLTACVECTLDLYPPQVRL